MNQQRNNYKILLAKSKELIEESNENKLIIQELKNDIKELEEKVPTFLPEFKDVPTESEEKGQILSSKYFDKSIKDFFASQQTQNIKLTKD